jgi:hypothetical protein
MDGRMNCTNEYGAFTERSLDIMDDVRQWFNGLVKFWPEIEIRELEYMAINAIGNEAAELVLLKAQRMRKEEQERKYGLKFDL